VFAPDSAGSYSQLHLPAREGETERSLSCIVNYWQAPRLQIILAECVLAGSVVGVEHDDMLLMGEVVFSTPQAHLWRADIHVEHTLNGLTNLMASREKPLGEAPATDGSLDRA
jgi:hypothetical protein